MNEQPAKPSDEIVTAGPSDTAGEGHEPEVLFIATYGKSGSTLLMGLLNSLPGFHIRGENGNVLALLWKYHSKAMDLSRKWAKEGPLPISHPWYGIDDYPAEVSLAHLRNLVSDTIFRPGPDTRVTGYKEIRWYDAGLDEYMKFLETLFPGAKFLLNTRDHDQVLRSSWWARKPDAKSDLERIERDLRAVIEKRGDRGYHIHYNDYLADPGKLEGLCDWLGVEYDAERFARVMEIKHTT